MARYNVGRWLRFPSSELDVAYLLQLGPPAWPELVRAARNPALPSREFVLPELRRRLAERRSALDGRPWPSWQWRPLRLCEETRIQLDSR